MESKPRQSEFSLVKDKDDREIENYFEDQKLLKTCREYSCLGEITLFNGGMMVTSSAVCKSAVLMATIGSEQFKSILVGCLGQRQLREIFGNTLQCIDDTLS